MQSTPSRVAVVFASSRGLGRASAQALAQQGFNLAICSRHKESIEQAAHEIHSKTGAHVLAQATDVTNPAAIRAFAQEVEQTFGWIDVLVNNSGGPLLGTFDTLREEDFAEATELLLLNVVRTTKAFLPLLRKKNRGGRIITITSTSVSEVIDNLILSNSLRAAVTGWSKTLARELAPENILVNCIAPGRFLTERMEEIVAGQAAKNDKSAEDLRTEIEKNLPMGRMGRPEEFAAAVAFLASDAASYISGTTLYVDGAATRAVV